MPVHTAYAVPKGSDRSASAINRKLSAIAISVATVGQNRVSPSEYFSPSAHPTSSTPAPSSASHAFTTFSFSCELHRYPRRIGCGAGFFRIMLKVTRVFHAMFARHAYDSEARRQRRQPVAKLKSAGDIVIESLIRGADEYATYRGRGAQQDVV
jgi:hypothetical protein